MADYTDIPVIGPYLGALLGFAQPKYNPKPGTLRGRTRVVDQRAIRRRERPGKTPLTPEQEAYYDQVAQLSYENQLGVYLGDMVFGAPPEAFVPPAQPAPLPDPIMESPPIVAQPPRIDLPVDLPEVVVNPPAVTPPREIAPPAPLEVPLEAIEFDPYGTGQPSVSPGARPGSAPATRSPARVSPVPAASPFPGNLLGIGSAFALASALAPGVAGDASAIPRARARPTPPAQRSPSPGTPPSIRPGTPVDFLNPIVPQIVGPVPSLNLGVFSAANPSPQQDTKRDKCKCDEKKKKESKPRQPRTKCFKGTFRQRAKGISYSRGEEIPCDGPLPKIPKAAKYAKRGKAPKIGELARDILGF